MAQAAKRSASSARSGARSSRRASSNGSRASARTQSSRARSASNKPRTQSRAKPRRRASTGSKPTASRNGASAGRGKDVGSRGWTDVGSKAKNVVLPAATAALGTAAGFMLERRHHRPRKVLGIPIPGTSNGVNGVAKEIRKAGEQFGKLASEVQTTRKKAEGVGKALS